MHDAADSAARLSSQGIKGVPRADFSTGKVSLPCTRSLKVRVRKDPRLVAEAAVVCGRGGSDVGEEGVVVMAREESEVAVLVMRSVEEVGEEGDGGVRPRDLAAAENASPWSVTICTRRYL